MLPFPTSRFTSMGTSALSRPVFLFSVIALTVSLIFTSIILAGGTSDAPVLRNNYLVSFKYNTDSEFYKTLEKIYAAKGKVEEIKDTVSDKVDDAKDTVTDVDLNPFSKLAKRADDKPTFSEIRVSYRALCVETSEGWDCAPSVDELPEQDISRDPLELIAVAGMYQDKIVWSVPFWITVASTALAFVMVVVNAIPLPFITVPLWTKKVALGSLALASVSSLAAMLLASVTSSSISTLVSTITLDAIEVHIGKMHVTFGWTVFSLVTASGLGVCAVVVAEWGANRVNKVVEGAAEKAIDRATGGRATLGDVEAARGGLGGLGRFTNGKGIDGAKRGFAWVKSMKK